MTGLYLHIPFCRSKCAYCDFSSFAGREDEIPAYLEALGREMALRAGEVVGGPSRPLSLSEGEGRATSPCVAYAIGMSSSATAHPRSIRSDAGGYGALRSRVRVQPDAQRMRSAAPSPESSPSKGEEPPGGDTSRRQTHPLPERERSVTSATCAVDTIYVGGGTPTLLGGERLAQLLRSVKQMFNVKQSAEITVEANPGTVDPDLLRLIRAAGCNRLSLGVQAFDDGVLRFLGRIHSADEAAAAVTEARQAGFDNLSVDLIYAVPGQSLASWRDTLQRARSLGIEHVSAYALTIEPGTPLAARIEAGEVAPVDDDACLEMMRQADTILGEAGLQRYEISNWARPGRECRHNLRYWRGGDYLGLGAGAHSFMGGIRWANVAAPGPYGALLAQGSLPVAWAERLARDRRAEEALLLALRTTEGALLPAGGRDSAPGRRNVLEGLVQAGLLEMSAGRMRLTEAGVAVANEVCLRLMR